jgi:hypothetical protein
MGFLENILVKTVRLVSCVAFSCDLLYLPGRVRANTLCRRPTLTQDVAQRKAKIRHGGIENYDRLRKAEGLDWARSGLAAYTINAFSSNQKPLTSP